MTAAAEATVLHRMCKPGQWPILSDQGIECAKLLSQIGIPRHAAAVLMAFRENGQNLQVTSWWLEHVTDVRQPEISLALAWLIKDRAVSIGRKLPAEGSGKGRPLKVYILNDSVDAYLQFKIQEYRQQAEIRIAGLLKVFPEVR
jgi:predicted transcriptional regulator